MSRRRNWSAVIDRLNRSPKGAITVKMGTPGSAQVTRVRLLEQWNGIEVRSGGSNLYLKLIRP